MIDNIRSLKNSFKSAFAGIKLCILFERNFRIHILSTITLFILVFVYYDLTYIEISILIFSCGFVLVCEAFNTCIEIIMNNINKDYDLSIKYIKDISASSVLISSISSFFIGLFILWDFEKFYLILNSILFTPLHLVFLFIYLFFGCCFVFLVGKDKR